MQRAIPRYVLLTEVTPSRFEGGEGSWQFTILAVAAQERTVVSDVEWGQSEERLHLLSVVRGLQSLDQPSAVTLLTTSRFVSNGIRHGLELWRENDWHWEHFGELVPVRHADLWKRLDGALAYHRVTARYWTGCNLSTPANRPQCTELSRHATRRQAGRVAAVGPRLKLFSGDMAVAPAI